MNTLMVTGSSGLIGSEVVDYFSREGWQVHGIDNNMRAYFFGAEGDTRRNTARLLRTHDHFRHHDVDIRNRVAVRQIVEQVNPGLVVHTAAQPSHDLAAKMPFDDFEVNALGTLNVLQAIRESVPDAVFVHMSTNKVYGDAPNRIQLMELDRRWSYADSAFQNGISEDFPIDQSTHSLFGVSKVAADVMVQEYGRYFGLKTCCLRGGCLTGPNHSGVELHGFLSYLIKCNVAGRLYRIHGYKGKQVRDNIHSLDVARFIHAFWENPRCGEVYNIGGGLPNSCSILEAFDMIFALSGKRMQYEYEDTPRVGDHICYVSNLSKMRTHYPKWDVTVGLNAIFEQIHSQWRENSA
jgi:CDP-paratose 2-epimerase